MITLDSGLLFGATLYILPHRRPYACTADEAAVTWHRVAYKYNNNIRVCDFSTTEIIIKQISTSCRQFHVPLVNFLSDHFRASSCMRVRARACHSCSALFHLRRVEGNRERSCYSNFLLIQRIRRESASSDVSNNNSDTTPLHVHIGYILSRMLLYNIFEPNLIILPP